jgi:hypothetical protein
MSTRHVGRQEAYRHGILITGRVERQYEGEGFGRVCRGRGGMASILCTWTLAVIVLLRVRDEFLPCVCVYVCVCVCVCVCGACVIRK